METEEEYFKKKFPPIDWSKKWEECKKKFETWTDEEKEYFWKINSVINTMKEYGHHIWKNTPPNSTILTWDNGGAKWFGYPAEGSEYFEKGRPAKEIGDLDLDADQIVVHAPFEIVEKMQGCFRPHPLYGLSFEAGARGEVDLDEKFTIWFTKQMEKAERAGKKLEREVI